MNKYELAESLYCDPSIYLQYVNRWRKDKSEGASYEIGRITGFFFYASKNASKRQNLTFHQTAEYYAFLFEDEAPFYDKKKISYLQTTFARSFIRGWIDGYFSG